MKKVRIFSGEDDPKVVYSSNDNLWYNWQSQDGCVWLYDGGNEDKELGLFKVFYDVDMEDREYICINNEITYLDTLEEM